MSRLEDIRPNIAIRVILPGNLITVFNVQCFGSEVLELISKDPSAPVANEIISRLDKPHQEVAEQDYPWSFDSNGHLFMLVSKANCIRRYVPVPFQSRLDFDVINMNYTFAELLARAEMSR